MPVLTIKQFSEYISFKYSAIPSSIHTMVIHVTTPLNVNYGDTNKSKIQQVYLIKIMYAKLCIKGTLICLLSQPIGMLIIF